MATATAERPSRAKSGTKPPRKLPEPFTRAACHILRQCSKISRDAQVGRAAAFKQRDGLIEELKQVKDDQPETKQKYKADIYDVLTEISRLDKVIKKAEAKMIDTIEKGDQEEMFPEVKVTVASLFEAPRTAEDGDDDDEADAAQDVRNADVLKEPVEAGT